MRQIAACLLVGVGIGGAGYCVEQTRVPLVIWIHGITAVMPDLTPDFIADWHFKEPHLPKLCFGLCPETEKLP